jgi:hypothetical protein
MSSRFRTSDLDHSMTSVHLSRQSTPPQPKMQLESICHGTDRKSNRERERGGGRDSVLARGVKCDFLGVNSRGALSPS